MLHLDLDLIATLAMTSKDSPHGGHKSSCHSPYTPLLELELLPVILNTRLMYQALVVTLHQAKLYPFSTSFAILLLERGS